jgi:hypothetical protein
MNRALMRAMLEMSMFLALSDDDATNSDAAIAQLEQLAAILKDLSPEERDELVRFAHERAVIERQNDREERAEFLLGVAENLGLDE